MSSEEKVHLLNALPVIDSCTGDGAFVLVRKTRLNIKVLRAIGIPAKLLLSSEETINILELVETYGGFQWDGTSFYKPS